jgi:hypothetical protein
LPSGARTGPVDIANVPSPINTTSSGAHENGACGSS